MPPAPPPPPDGMPDGGPPRADRPIIDTQGQTMAAESGAQQLAPNQTARNRSGLSRPLPPPPPPPRSTLPPVRPIIETAEPASGIGSARTRWRGDMPAIDPTAPAPLAAPPRTDTTLPNADPDEPEEDLTRSAPSWLLSVAIHLIVLLVLALIASPGGSGFTSLVLDFGISDSTADDAYELDISTPMTEEVIDAELDAIDDSMVETEIPDVFEVVKPAELETIQPILDGPTTSIDIAKPMFSGRTGAMRKALMAMYGATDQTQEAVRLGLAWLQRQQHKTGYWSLQRPYDNGGVSENIPAATAMALIAFAGDGNTHLQGPYRQEVDKGVKYLVSLQDRGGFMAANARGNERTYAQAQATIALCELYGMTRDSWLRPYAQRAVDYAEKAQSSGGGWRYRPGEPGDTSVTGWYVMALQSAISSGLEVNPATMNLVSMYLDSASVYYGAGYAYQPGSSSASPTMTAEGLLCRQYLGWERNHGALNDGMDLLMADAPFDINRQNVYYWYYATQVFHHVGGKRWTTWNDEMKVKLPALQIKSGKERGSWAPQQDRWSVGGRLYTTCLSIYCLEVYYRHLPLYDQH